MGGAATVSGNVNPAAEANIYNDPHAADRVFTARWPMLTMVGLDVTEQVIMDEEYLRSLRASRTGAYIEEISRFYIDFYERANGLRMCHTHDPSAIAYVIDPTLFRARVGPIRVVGDGLARGQTIWDRRQHWWGPHAWTDRPADQRVRRGGGRTAAGSVQGTHLGSGCKGNPVPDAAMIDYFTFSLIIDDLVLPDGRTYMGLLGGGGPQTAFGMKLWTAGSVGLCAGVGADFPPAAQKWLDAMEIDTAGVRSAASASHLARLADP